MCNQSEWIVREAFLAYTQGDIARLMQYVDPDVEWIRLNQDPGNPAQPRMGRQELEQALRLQASRGLRAEVEEVIASGDKVMLIMRTPGLDKQSEHPTGDRTFDVVTVKNGLIAGVQACCDRVAARTLIGIG